MTDNQFCLISKLNDMKTISKKFKSIKDAVNYRSKLYEKYHFVKITDAPLFDENGTYTFSVNNNPFKGQDQNY